MFPTAPIRLAEPPIRLATPAEALAAKRRDLVRAIEDKIVGQIASCEPTGSPPADTFAALALPGLTTEEFAVSVGFLLFRERLELTDGILHLGPAEVPIQPV